MRLRTIVIVVVVVLVALVATGVGILMSIDFNQYKGLISAQVKEATGRDLVIGGDLKLGISLSPTVSVDNVTFSNAPGGSKPLMASLKQVGVQMELLPLLSHKVKVDRIILDGADILLETDAKGIGNWVFETAATPASTAATTTTAPAAGGEATSLPEIDSVQIRNSTVTYRDGVAGTTRSFKIDKLDADSSNGSLSINLAALIGQAPLNVQGSVGAPDLLTGGGPYPIDLAFSSGDTSATVKGAIADVSKMQGLAFDVAARGHALSDLNGLTGASLPQLGPYKLAGKLVDIPGGYKISGLQLTMGDSSMTGDVSLALGGKRPKIAGNLAATKIDLKDFGVKPPAGGGGSAAGGSGSSDGRVFPATPLPFGGLTALDADINFTAQQLIKAPVTMENLKLVMSLLAGKLQVKPFSTDISGGTLTLALTVDGAKSPAPISLDLNENQVEAGSLMKVLTGSSVLSGGKVNMKIAVNGAGNSVRAIMAGLNGKLDATMGAGNIDNRFAKIMLADLFKLLSFGGGGDTSNLKCVVMRYDISHGLATTRQLAVETSGATIIGKGTINLASEGLDLHLVPYATSANLTALAIPVIVGGTMANPNVVPDAAAMATGTLNSVISVPSGALGALGNVVGGVTGGSTGGGTNASADTSSGCGASAASATKNSTTKQPTTGGTGTTGTSGGGGIVPDVGGALKSILP
jgi:AsmA family protein